MSTTTTNLLSAGEANHACHHQNLVRSPRRATNWLFPLDAAITGSVRTPGIYELIDGETIGEALDFAGKTSAVASDTRLSVDRVADHQSRQAAEFAMNASGLATALADGDILRVYAVIGLIVVALAQVLVHFVLQKISGASGGSSVGA